MKKFSLAALALVLLLGCKPSHEANISYIFPEGPGEDASLSPGESADPSGEEPSGEDPSGEDPSGEDPSGEESLDPSVAKVPCWIWIDSSANFPDFSQGEEIIRRDLEKAADAGFTHIIAEVRPTTGDLLFSSSHCQQVEFLGAWTSGGYKKIAWDQSFDYLATFIKVGHELGLKVFAGFNTFVAGRRTSFGDQGIVFRDTKMAALATTQNTKEGLLNALDVSGENEIFFNPVHEGVQEYLCNLLKDLAAYEGLDGIILDRGRFQGWRSDFSDYTRAKFEVYIGKTLSAWPEDVLPKGYKWNDDWGNGVPSPVPPQYKKWNEFRAKTIHDFMVKAREAVKGVNPDVAFGAYVGGWYGSYYENGVNWASPEFNTSASYPSWASTSYKDFGFADHMDVLLIGAYASPKSIYGSNEWTMQGFCKLAFQKVKHACPVYGGPDVGNWSTDGVSKTQEYEAVQKSVTACANECDGYFLFDMIHLKQQPNKWKYVKQGIEDLNNQ